jgi:hypothetical protein
VEATVLGEAILGLRPTSAPTKGVIELDTPRRRASRETGVAGSGDHPPPSIPSRGSIRARPLAGRAVDAPATWSIMSSRWSAAERTRPETCSGRQLRRAKPRTKPKAGAANFDREADLKLPSHTSFRCRSNRLAEGRCDLTEFSIQSFLPADLLSPIALGCGICLAGFPSILNRPKSFSWVRVW